MLGKLRWLAVAWLLTGCTAVSWEKIPVDNSWGKNGWDSAHYKKIDNYEIFIFTGQQDGQTGLMLFCSNDPYRRSWEKIIVRYADGRIDRFDFIAKVNGQWTTRYNEEAARWQDADFNCLRDRKNLQDLPKPVKLKILQILQYGDNKYFAPPPGRTYPAPSRLTKFG